MSLVLELSPELERALSAEAARLQLPLAEYAVRVLAGAGAMDAAPSSGAELVAYWKRAGLVGSRSDISDAPDHARALRQSAEKRMR